MSKIKVISFALWNNLPIYSLGAIANAKIAKTLYKGFIPRFYCRDDVNQDTIQTLKDLGSQIVIFKQIRGDFEGMFQRFLPAGEENVELFLSRDCDSRLNEREKAAVDEWICSCKKFIILRDNRDHTGTKIPGGLWGCKGDFLTGMKKMIEEWKDFDKKGTDQTFLSEKIWPIILGEEICFDLYDEGIIFFPDGETCRPKELIEYNPWDNCGDAHEKDFPHGKIIRTDGKVFQRLDCYCYFPQSLDFFGPHNIRPFPKHGNMNYGSYCGEVIKV